MSRESNKEIGFMGFKSATSRFEMIPESGSNQIFGSIKIEDELFELASVLVDKTIHASKLRGSQMKTLDFENRFDCTHCVPNDGNSKY